ncbi:hypothetical protein NBZ79_00565 [Sneathiella marina]|uniref:Lipoprotein n=1 Tax=Sneathiella marina TaxID=2950108 RepID=A0ABY4W2P8_9PROT|nr:hypothetical protein [Sneathiella marina]USG61467.1 hypothetical protein NBZ79_00565 [Sneathiella marina]
MRSRTILSKNWFMELRMRYFVVLLVLALLSGCVTTNQKPVDISDVDLNDPYTVGVWFAFSNLCEKHHGIASENDAGLALLNKYSFDGRFMQGLMVYDDVSSDDAIKSSRQCYKAKAAVEAAAAAFTHQYVLDLAWDSLLEGRKVHSVLVEEYSRAKIVKQTTLVAGKTCSMILRYGRQDGTDDWEIKCTDRTSAIGFLDVEGEKFHGTGWDNNKNKIDFIIQKAPAS